MCVCKHISENISKYIVEVSSPSGFFDVKIGDVANIIIAGLTVTLSIYVFVYQRRKDKTDEVTIVTQSIKNTRLEMFKLLIIEPNVSDLYLLIKNAEISIHKLNGVAVTPALKSIVVAELDSYFNDFESRFIDLLAGVNDAFYSDMLSLYDLMRDDISDRINQLPNGVISPINNIIDSFSDNKINFISGIYNFNNE